MKLNDLKKLSYEWQILIVTFGLSCIIIFIYSIALVSRAALCVSSDCMIPGLSNFALTAFVLLVVNVFAVLFFLFIHVSKHRFK